MALGSVFGVNIPTVADFELKTQHQLHVLRFQQGRLGAAPPTGCEQAERRQGGWGEPGTGAVHPPVLGASVLTAEPFPAHAATSLVVKRQDPPH